MYCSDIHGCDSETVLLPNRLNQENCYEQVTLIKVSEDVNNKDEMSDGQVDSGEPEYKQAP